MAANNVPKKGTFEQKFCKKCDEITEFYVPPEPKFPKDEDETCYVNGGTYGITPSGRKRYKRSPICQQCRDRQYQERKDSGAQAKDDEKTLALKRYIKAIAREHLGGKCSTVGCNALVHNVQFNHIDPSKKTMGVCDMVGNGKSPEKVWAEVDKCELLCGNCHHNHTWPRDKVPDGMTPHEWDLQGGPLGEIPKEWERYNRENYEGLSR